MSLNKKLHPIFIFTPLISMLVIGYFATSNDRAADKEWEKTKSEKCMQITGGHKSEIMEIAQSEGIDNDIALGCIKKGALPENIKTYDQLLAFIEKRKSKLQEKRLKEEQARQAEQAKELAERERKSNLNLADARAEFYTREKRDSIANEALPTPPDHLFDQVEYKSSYLNLPAFVTKNPRDGKKHPAIIWLTGGESNTLSDLFWEKRNPTADQSASQYRDAGIVMMYPTLRGGNRNNGKIENNYGEVNDIIAAANLLATLPYVDPNHIYLGGHSTGGTLVLLTSEVASQTQPSLFKAVFSFGATGESLNFSGSEEETRLRAPKYFLNDITVPTFLIEGKQEPSNADNLAAMCESNTNSRVKCVLPSNYNHFDILLPMNEYIASQILINPDAISINDNSIN